MGKRQAACTVQQELSLVKMGCGSNILYEILRKSEAYFKLCCGRTNVRTRSARGSYIVDTGCPVMQNL